MMNEKFLISGLNGAKKLSGEIPVKGSKNAVLPAMASALLFSNPISIENAPEIEDVKRMSELLEHLGCRVQIGPRRKITIDSKKINTSELEKEISKRLRASIILTGPVLAKTGKVFFPHPGGCVIGERPIDIFLNGFRSMGAKVTQKKDRYIVKARGGRLTGARIFFKVPSVTATETFMMAGVLAQGQTVLENVSLEPEVLALGEFLKENGAKISGLGTTRIEIGGTKNLRAKKSFQTIPDRLETGCFLILAAIAGRRIKITNCNPEHVGVLIKMLADMGVKIRVGKNFIEVWNGGIRKNTKLKSTSIKTHEYPGFPTDLQAPMLVLLTQAKGESVVFETIFDGRLNYTDDLVKMGADITLWDAHRAAIRGPRKLHGRELAGPDIRAGLAFIIAAIIAKGKSVINNIYYVDRGYEKIEERLKKIGVDIKRVGEN